MCWLFFKTRKEPCISVEIIDDDQAIITVTDDKGVKKKWNAILFTEKQIALIDEAKKNLKNR